MVFGLELAAHVNLCAAICQGWTTLRNPALLAPHALCFTCDHLGHAEVIRASTECGVNICCPVQILQRLVSLAPDGHLDAVMTNPTFKLRPGGSTGIRGSLVDLQAASPASMCQTLPMHNAESSCQLLTSCHHAEAAANQEKKARLKARRTGGTAQPVAFKPATAEDPIEKACSLTVHLQKSSPKYCSPLTCQRKGLQVNHPGSRIAPDCCEYESMRPTWKMISWLAGALIEVVITCRWSGRGECGRRFPQRRFPVSRGQVMCWTICLAAGRRFCACREDSAPSLTSRCKPPRRPSLPRRASAALSAFLILYTVQAWLAVRLLHDQSTLPSGMHRGGAFVSRFRLPTRRNISQSSRLRSITLHRHCFEPPAASYCLAASHFIAAANFYL